MTNGQMLSNKLSDNTKAFLIMAGVISVILVVTSALVSKFGWFTAGHVLFGFTIGLMIGMTKSATVSSALPLLFSFAGGSIIALSSTNNPTDPQQLATLGHQLCGFGSGTSVGLLLGVFLQKVSFVLPLGKFSD